jgi:hypothetical protein
MIPYLFTEKAVETDRSQNATALPFKDTNTRLGLLCAVSFADPPHDLRWMKAVPSEEVELLVSVMSDPTFMDALETIQSNALFKERQSDILSARGFIAYGSLFHGLEAGIALTTACSLAPKQMAVPLFSQRYKATCAVQSS